MSYTTVNFFRSCLCHIVDQNDDIVSTIMEKLKELDVGRCYLSQFLANLLNCLDDDSFDPSTRYFKELFYMCMDIDKRYNDTEPAPHPRNLTLIGKQKRMKYQLDYSLFESYPNTSFNQLAYRNEYITPEGYVYVDYDEYALGVALQIIKGNPYDVTHLTYNEIQNVSNVFKYFSLDVPSYIEESLKRIESASIKRERSSPPLGTNHCTPTDRGSQVPLCVYNELSRSSPSFMTNNNEANTVVTRHLHKEDYQRRKKHTMEDEDSEDLKSMNGNEGNAGTDNQLIEFNAPDEEDGAPERVTPADNLNSSKEQPCEQKPEIVNFSTSSVPSKKAFNQKYKERNNSTNGSARVIKQRMVFNMLAKQSSINSWMNSIIIDDRYNECLSNWVGHHNSWNLAYRGSIHGFGAQHFHEACDNIGESLVLIRSYTENTTPTMGKQTYECIFGGYSKVGWVTKDFISDQGIIDDDAFIFTLKNPYQTEPRRFMKGDDKYCTLEYNSQYGPIFSLAIYIRDHCNQTDHNFIYSNPEKNAYEFDPFYRATLFTCTSSNKKRNSFVVDEIEVFTTNKAIVPPDGNVDSCHP